MLHQSVETTTRRPNDRQLASGVDACPNPDSQSGCKNVGTCFIWLLYLQQGYRPWSVIDS